jgi:hypothetical protein
MIVSNLAFGWLWITAGFISGGIIGLSFRKADYLGGYNALPRRLVRLGHISFYGLGSINIMYGLSKLQLEWSGSLLPSAEWALIVGAIAMPAACFLTAWREQLHHVFYIPVASLIYAGAVVVWIALSASIPS